MNEFEQESDFGETSFENSRPEREHQLTNSQFKQNDYRFSIFLRHHSQRLRQHFRKALSL